MDGTMAHHTCNSLKTTLATADESLNEILDLRTMDK